MIARKSEMGATEKERQRLEIAQDIEAFVARGGRIEVLVKPAVPISGSAEELEDGIAEATLPWSSAEESSLF